MGDPYWDVFFPEDVSDPVIESLTITITGSPPRSANALETNALSLTPDYVYEEMQYTSSRVTTAANNTLVAPHASSMIA